ncbi:unnamed protein product [Arctia plantaginis]|uniref:Uncharacterized protein n=1 Tax=Arctia plantaginis TaxID=874455 RepID=A0A8S0Z620_ARCPL|nr:unnamed protein product [Arctia plantaginis]
MPLEKAENSVDLLETDVIVVSKKGCRNHWDERYHYIINSQMICTKDASDYMESEACLEHGANCKPLDDSDSEYFEMTPVVPKRRMIIDPKNLIVHTAAHHRSTRRFEMSVGGFCENDHGGPLVIGRGKNAMIIGIMSACQTKTIMQKCFGPFLYTSVFKYREIIYFCSTPELGWRCKKLIRSSNSMYQETSYDWNNQSDGTQRMDSSGKFVLRSYAQTPLHPIVSPLVTEDSFKSNVSATIEVTTQELLKSQTEVQHKNVQKFSTSEKSEPNTLSSVINTSTQPSTLKFLLPQILGDSVPKNSSRLTQMRKSLNHKKNAKSANISHVVSKSVTSKKNAGLYMRVQDWQQNYLNYLNNM